MTEVGQNLCYASAIKRKKPTTYKKRKDRVIMKKLISLLLAVLLLAALGACAYADTGLGIEPGDAMPDFTVELTDGTTATASKTMTSPQ